MNYKNAVFNDVIVQGDIIEYDITAAGINVMYAEGIISKGLYDYWMSLPKEIRNIKAGIHIGDNGLQPKKEKALNKYIIEKYGCFVVYCRCIYLNERAAVEYAGFFRTNEGKSDMEEFGKCSRINTRCSGEIW